MLTRSKAYPRSTAYGGGMDSHRETQVVRALKAYVEGDSSEPVVISALKEVALEERGALVGRHRAELEAIDGARLVILESMLLPLEQRSG